MLPTNPGAYPALKPPPHVTWLPQEATINLLGQPTNCYVLHGARGDWVVDPPSASEAALAEIEGAARGPLRGILVTHAHPDHIGGVAVLAARHALSVLAHPRAAEALGREVTALREGDVVGGWRVWELPGHRFDHLAFDDGAGCVIAGDLVAGAGTVILDPDDGDLGDYLRSLARLRDELRPALLCPGHGPLIGDPTRLLDYFIEHRLARERHVLAALGPEPRAIEALLPLAYADTSPALYPLAARSLLTHLRKLRDEGRAEEEEGEWRRMDDEVMRSKRMRGVRG